MTVYSTVKQVGTMVHQRPAMTSGTWPATTTAATITRAMDTAIPATAIQRIPDMTTAPTTARTGVAMHSRPTRDMTLTVSNRMPVGT